MASQPPADNGWELFGPLLLRRRSIASASLVAFNSLAPVKHSEPWPPDFLQPMVGRFGWRVKLPSLKNSSGSANYKFWQIRAEKVVFCSIRGVKCSWSRMDPPSTNISHDCPNFVKSFLSITRIKQAEETELGLQLKWYSSIQYTVILLYYSHCSWRCVSSVEIWSKPECAPLISQELQHLTLSLLKITTDKGEILHR